MKHTFSKEDIRLLEMFASDEKETLERLADLSFEEKVAELEEDGIKVKELLGRIHLILESKSAQPSVALGQTGNAIESAHGQNQASPASALTGQSGIVSTITEGLNNLGKLVADFMAITPSLTPTVAHLGEGKPAQRITIPLDDYFGVDELEQVFPLTEVKLLLDWQRAEEEKKDRIVVKVDGKRVAGNKHHDACLHVKIVTGKHTAGCRLDQHHRSKPVVLDFTNATLPKVFVSLERKGHERTAHKIPSN